MTTTHRPVHRVLPALVLAATLFAAGACGDVAEQAEDDVPALHIPAENVLRAAEDLANARRLVDAGAESDAEPLLVSVIGADAGSAEAWALLGQVLRKLDRHGEAVPVLRRAIEMSPRDALLRHGLGDSLDRLGHLGDAEATYRAWLEIQKNDAEARFQLGSLLYRQGRFRGAVRQLTLASDARQNQAVWRSELGLALRALGDLDASEAAQRDATERDPRCAVAWLRLGNLIYERRPEILDDVIAAHRRAVALDPSDIAAQLYLYRTLRDAAKAGDDNAAREADERFERVLTLHSPRQLAGSRPRVKLSGSDLDREIRRLRSQVEETPDVVADRTRLAHLLHARDDFDEALEHYDVLVRDAAAPANVLSDAGAANLLVGERERAVVLLRRAIAQDAEPLPPHRHLAWSLLESGQVDEALATYAVARERAPDDRLLALGEGLARVRAGDIEKGLVQIAEHAWLN